MTLKLYATPLERRKPSKQSNGRPDGHTPVKKALAERQPRPLVAFSLLRYPGTLDNAKRLGGPFLSLCAGVPRRHQYGQASSRTTFRIPQARSSPTMRRSRQRLSYGRRARRETPRRRGAIIWREPTPERAGDKDSFRGMIEKRPEPPKAVHSLENNIMTLTMYVLQSPFSLPFSLCLGTVSDWRYGVIFIDPARHTAHNPARAGSSDRPTPHSGHDGS